MRLFKLVRDNRPDGANDWHEAVVCAEDEEDAISATGFTAYPRESVAVEDIGAPTDGSRGIICSGLHDHEEFKCLHPGCDMPSLFLCSDHASEFPARVQERARKSATDLVTASRAVVMSWTKLWSDPDHNALEVFASKILDLALALKDPK